MNAIRNISCSVITEAVKNLFIEANTDLCDDVLAAIENAIDIEESALGKHALKKISENAYIAREEHEPICQDTGLAVVFVEVGQNVHVVGGSLYDAIQTGVKKAYQEGYLRKSVCDPLSRQNTGDNTPAIIHASIVETNTIKIIAMPKGGGSENMSSTVMLLPAAGIEGIKSHVIEAVRAAGPNPCPPVIVGIGIGGSIEQSAILAKKALLRPMGMNNSSDERIMNLEKELLIKINNLGIGPQGYGGTVTALAVNIEMMPCHIASLPVSVNIQCHVARHKEVII